MARGLHIERVPADIRDAPSLRVCADMARCFEEHPAIAGSVLLAVTPTSPRHLWISLLHVADPLRGIGGGTLDALCLASDEHAVTIELQAISRNRGLDQNGLISFYARRGFERDARTARTNAMRRDPASRQARARSVEIVVREMLTA